ncbi:MAG: hypothetical protein JXN64_04870 [Spirochaetes bacterium]|nr:hypothetical protein [Spirochaetota bacterium]
MDNYELKKDLESIQLDKADFLKIEKLIREEKNLESVAELILEGSYHSVDIFKKDSIDRFLDFIIAKVRTGSYYIPTLAFPTRRMSDQELEDKIIKLINVHLNPEVIFPILKYFARNIKDSDKNLYLAYLITSDDIISAIYETFLLFKKDIFSPDPEKRVLNVKRIQQFPPTVDTSASSPLDAVCRFKYILEFIAIKQKVEHIYTADKIKLST